MQDTRLDERLPVLDGWRGISILLVLAAHLLPLGPKTWQLNVAAGMVGMACFFVLSGFLVTRMLLHRPDVPGFLLRRLFRILPLAWAYLIVALSLENAPLSAWVAHLLFYANLMPQALQGATAHFWSLGVEMQFYLGVALLVACLQRRGLLLLPLLCLAFTALRIADGIHFSSLSQYRVDEILAGATLALVCEHPAFKLIRAGLARCPTLPALLLLLLSCHPAGGFLNYLRPYCAALLVGTTLLAPTSPLAPLLGLRLLAYFASISYALYVIHPLLASTWLGSGEDWDKYLKRPLLFVVLLVVAHLLSRHFEGRWTALGKRLAERRESLLSIKGGRLLEQSGGTGSN
ncbi:MAG: acyltransferase [Rhodocyclaceae bacterium]|nr:MAG: acyltransferase [Rhodocyclaceae bacterium]